MIRIMYKEKYLPLYSCKNGTKNYTKTKRTGFRRNLEIKGTEKQKIITELLILYTKSCCFSGVYHNNEPVHLASDMSIIQPLLAQQFKLT